MKLNFPRRAELGEGYPWAVGVDAYFDIQLRHAEVGGISLPLEFPKELWSKDVPRYRLVLERMNNKRETQNEGGYL